MAGMDYTSAIEALMMLGRVEVSVREEDSWDMHRTAARSRPRTRPPHLLPLGCYGSRAILDKVLRMCILRSDSVSTG